MTKLTPIAILLAAAPFLSARFAQAAAPDPSTTAAILAPYFDEQTIAVVRIDCSHIDPSAVLDKWVELVPSAKYEADRTRDAAKAIRDAFVDAKCPEVYLVVSLADVPTTPPFLLAPKRGGADGAPLIARLTELLHAGPGLKIVDRGDAVIAAPAPALARIEQGRPDPRPQLVTALEATGNHAVHVVLLPTADNRRVIEELMPTLPAVVGGGPTTVVTHGVQWLALGLDAPPHAAASLVIQSQNATAAAALAEAWANAAAALSASNDQMLPPIRALVKLLKPKVENDRLLLSFSESDLPPLLGALQPPLAELQLAERRRQSFHNLKQIALGLLNYESAQKRLPAVATYDSAGQPLLSSRVYAAAFMEHQDLYKQFHLNEPWDSPHNKTLIAKMPEEFRCPGSKYKATDGMCTYREIVGDHYAFRSREGITWKDMADGSSNTLLVVEVDDDHAVPWTKPEPMPFDPEHPFAGLGGHFPDGIHAAFCDGHVQVLKNPPVTDAMLRALLTIDGGEPIKWSATAP